MVWTPDQLVHNDEQPVRAKPYSWAYSVDPVKFTPEAPTGWYPLLAQPDAPKKYTWAYSVDPLTFTPVEITFGWLTANTEIRRPGPYTWCYSVDPVTFAALIAAAGAAKGSHALMGVGI